MTLSDDEEKPLGLPVIGLELCGGLWSSNTLGIIPEMGAKQTIEGATLRSATSEESWSNLSYARLPVYGRDVRQDSTRFLCYFRVWSPGIDCLAERTLKFLVSWEE